MALQTEVVVYTLESAVNAQEGGADRVELCDNPSGGGTTPSAGTVAVARQRLSISLFVMVRPREGDFCYSDDEFDAMKHDIAHFKELGADGVVFGILNPDGTLDTKRCKALVDLAHPLPATCHRAFDMTAAPEQALQDCIDVGFQRILTSGQEAQAIDGLPLIRALVQQADDDIIIMPGCGVNEQTVEQILKTSGARDIHISAEKTRSSGMQFENPSIQGMGSAKGQEYERVVTDASRVREIKARAEKAARS